MADPTGLGIRYSTLTGAGTQYRGKLDACSSSGVVIHNSVELKADPAAVCRVQHCEDFHRPRLIVRERNCRDVARGRKPPGERSSATGKLETVSTLDSGDFPVVVEDDFTGGDFRLVIIDGGHPGK